MKIPRISAKAAPTLLLLLALGAQASEWRVYGGSNASTRYSPLDQINRDNVGDLEVLWRWKADNFGPRLEYKYSVTPIMVDGVLYTTAGYRRAVVAIDAKTGETLWVYRYDEGARAESAPRRNSGRGVAYWSDDAGRARILFITPAYHLIALDAQTGRPVLDFGTDGVVDLRDDLDQAVDKQQVRIGSSSPPMIVGDVVVVGAALDTGTRPPSPEHVAGHVRGYDVRSGKRRWIFHTIPQANEFGNRTWEDESWTYTGNTAVWTPMSADDELGYVYLPVEAATGDYYGGHRPGDNLFSSSLVCLDAATGKRVWHYQLVHHDIWDLDNVTAPILADIRVDGRPVKAVVQLTKQNFAYVFDRVTGKPVWPMIETPVPASKVPGERTAPTQPIPTRPAPYDRQGITEDDFIDFTPELKAEAVAFASNYDLGQLFTPPSLANEAAGKKGTLNMPGSLGGANWEGGALDPDTGMLYVASMSLPNVFVLVNSPDVSTMRYVGGSMFPPRVLPLIKPPYGRITAIDLNAGEHRWMMANGEASARLRNNPLLQGIKLGRTGKTTRAGLLVTKTLLFAGEGYGGDPVLRAHDKATGEILHEFELPATQSGLPMTYSIDGQQIIVIAVSGPGHPGELVALGLSE